MSTLVWDGSELVADSRLTFSFRLFGDRQITWGRNNALNKLHRGGSYTWGGTPVQVFGAVGNPRIMRFLERARWLAGSDLVDLQNIATYTPAMRVKLEFELLVVTASHVATVATHHDKGLEFLKFNTWDRHTPRVVGSGKGHLCAELLTVGMNARSALSWVRFLDSYSGGRLTVWDGATIHTFVKPTGFLLSCWRAFQAHWRLRRLACGCGNEEPA